MRNEFGKISQVVESVEKSVADANRRYETLTPDEFAGAFDLVIAAADQALRESRKSVLRAETARMDAKIALGKPMINY